MILLAPDKFKFSLSSNEFCETVEKVIKSKLHYVNIKSLPLSDGGDGFLEVVRHYKDDCISHKVNVLDPLMQNEIEVPYLADMQGTVYLETALASGLKTISPRLRNPLITNTYGMGQMIKFLFDSGHTDINIGIGGTATNDFGIGMATALGFRFLDCNGDNLKPIGENLLKIDSIIPGQIYHSNIKIKGFYDVKIPLTGIEGCTYQFSSQKGAGDKEKEILENGILNLIGKINKQFNADIFPDSEGGAGGCLAAGLSCFLNADLSSGSTYCINISKFKDYLPVAKFIITGEGCLDNQTIHGKLISEILTIARKYEIKIIGIVGKNELSQTETELMGFTKVYSLSDYTSENQDSIEDAKNILSLVCEIFIKDFLN